MELEFVPFGKKKNIPEYLGEYSSDIGISHVVELREHNPRYNKIFSKESERLMSDFGELPVSIHHVGSTAVEGLCAKPIIDMLLAYPETVAFEDIRRILVSKGYSFREDLLPDRTYFVLEDEQGIRYFSITAHQDGDARAEGILAFRDNLRNDPTIVEEYDAIKRRLSVETVDRKEYTDQKSAFIQQHSKR